MPRYATTNRYSVLVRVLDQLRNEAPLEFKSYHPSEMDVDALNTARAKAFIHLFMKVYFGLIDFPSRETYITEGTYDGGIDAYFIDTDGKTIYFIQSKFRQSERNFEEKTIDPEELLKMDIGRILDGETSDRSGNPYNAKIRHMTDRIRHTDGISRYKYRVIILANAKGITLEKLNVLTGDFQTQIFDYKECYSRLVFPLVSGTYFNADALHLSLNLSNKNAASKISYTATTQYGRCEITVVFVPTLEIAKAMYLYRNAILKFNPRSYLEHEGQIVNRQIRNSIENLRTNEFALFNNGITLISDETYLNERIGQKDRAQLTLINPQIINGGQTAYTLSQIYKDYLSSSYEDIFGDKEVLLKIITFDHAPAPSETEKQALIESISRATNSQTVVTNADRRSNEPPVQQLQQRAFQQLGIFLERKRGEFSDGIREGYITYDETVDRNIFLRAALISQGRLEDATLKRIMAKVDFDSILNVTDDEFQQYGATLIMLLRLHSKPFKPLAPLDRHLVTQTWICLRIASSQGILSSSREHELTSIADNVSSKWEEFKQYYWDLPSNSRYHYADRKDRDIFNYRQYMNSEKVLQDSMAFFNYPQNPS
jgi:hypothetical protein